MIHARTLCIAAALACSAGASLAVTIEMKEYGPTNWWGNAPVVSIDPTGGGFVGKTFDFWWSGTPAVGSVALGAYGWSPSAELLTFSNLALWRCGSNCNERLPFEAPLTSLTRSTAGTNRFSMLPTNLEAGHYLFSFDVENRMESAAKVYAWVGVEAATGPAITPVPEPGTWALMLAGLGVVGVAALRARREADHASV